MRNFKLKIKAGSFVDTRGHEYLSSDWRDTADLLTNIDAQLETFGLELRLGDFGDNNNWIAIAKKSKT